MCIGAVSGAGFVIGERLGVLCDGAPSTSRTGVISAQCSRGAFGKKSS